MAIHNYASLDIELNEFSTTFDSSTHNYFTSAFLSRANDMAERELAGKSRARNVFCRVADSQEETHSKAARFPQAARFGPRTPGARTVRWRPFITVFLNWFPILVGRVERGMSVAFASSAVAAGESTAW